MDVKASGVLGWRMVGSRRMVRWRVVELRDEVFCSTIDGLLEEEEEEEEGNKGNKGNKGKKKVGCTGLTPRSLLVVKIIFTEFHVGMLTNCVSA